MKKIFILSFLFIITVSNSFSQSGWFFQNPYPTGEYLYTIKHFNESVCLAAGSAGTVLKSTNRGVNWYSTLNTTNTIRSSSFINENTGWISGDGTQIFKTSNQGSSWTTIETGNTFGNVSIQFINENTGWTCGGCGTIKKSINGGLNWTIIPVLDCLEYPSFLSSINFVDAQKGWIAGYVLTEGITRGIIMKSVDGGMNWTGQYLGADNSNFRKIKFLNENTGWALGDYGKFLKTTNGGSNWDEINIFTAAHLFDIHFIGSTNLWVSSGNGIIYKTIDGGFNWSLFNINSESIYSFSFNDSLNGFASGSSGTVLITSNGGTNWDLLSKGVNVTLRSVFFTDENTGHAMGLYGAYMKTTNGGDDWNYINTGLNSHFDVNFINKNTGWSVGERSAYLLKTTNGGNNWFSQYTFLNGILHKSFFLNDQTGWVAGDKIMKTTNGGDLWETQLTFPGQDLLSIQFTDQNTGWACGGYTPGVVYRTTNGGTDWTEQLNNSFVSYNDIAFFNSSTGYIAGSDIYQTTNSGDNWNLINGLALLRFSFLNKETAYGISAGKVSKTTNGAIGWDQQVIHTNAALFGLHFINENTGWVVGNGIILKTTTGGLTAINNYSNAIPEYFELFQNYPNPFNPRTIIKYELALTGNVSLKIYNILGKEIQVLVNQKQYAGKHSIEWIADNFPSGVYFYRLESNDQVETKRMVLIK